MPARNHQATRRRWQLTIGATTALTIAIGSLAWNWSIDITSEPDLTTSCSEFDAWAVANRYWLAHLDDADVLNGLDTNGNLIPCEQLADNPFVERSALTMNYVCDDFDYQEQAQHWFETWLAAYPELQRLDGDRNGIACQSLPTMDDIPAIALRLNRLEKAGLR